jgi:hypothetical protein
MDTNLIIAKSYRRAVVEHINGWGLPYSQAEHLSLFHCVFVEWQVVSVQIDRRGERRFRLTNTRDVIYMCVGKQDVSDSQRMTSRSIDELFNLVARVDHDRVARPVATDDESVLVERRYGARFKNHPYPL